MFYKIVDMFRGLNRNIAIDLGSENTIIANHIGVNGADSIINIQPTSVAYNRSTDEIYIGVDADKLIDKSPDFKITNPVRNGVIVDDRVAVSLVKKLITKVVKNNLLVSCNFYIAIPSSSSAVDIKTFKEVLYDAGAGNVYLIDSTLATALGAGLDVNGEETYMILNIGADVTEMGVVSMNKTIFQKTFKIGGVNICNAIISIVRDIYGVSIGYKTSMRLLKNLGTFNLNDSNRFDYEEVKGKSLNISDVLVAKRINVNRGDVYDAIIYVFNQLIYKIGDEMSEIPSDIISEIMSGGIHIAGGVSNIAGVEDFLENNLGIQSSIVSESKMCIINGLFRSIEMNTKGGK